MDSTSSALLFTIIICILLSGYFSSTETAFSSLNRARLKGYVKNGDRGAALAYDLSDQFDRILSTILIGNNIVNIVSASLATVLCTRLMVGNESAAVTVSTIVMTITVLIFGEITPKTLAKEFPERWAMISAPALRLFMVVLFPLSLPFALWKQLLGKLFHFEQDMGTSDEELITIVEETEQLGGFDEHESKLIRSAIEFDECDASDILTSRFDVVAIPKTATMQEVQALFLEKEFSRMPVYEENIDQIVGFILEKDFYKLLFQGAQSFESIIHPVHFSVARTKISDLLRELQQSKSHLSVVVDEFGSTAGIITVEDILEELVGEIWDEHDEVIVPFNEIGENQYKVLCPVNLKDFFEFFHKPVDLEEYEDIQTVNGWLMDELEHLPVEGETYVYQNLSITVAKTEYTRILELDVVVTPLDDDAEQDGDA